MINQFLYAYSMIFIETRCDKFFKTCTNLGQFLNKSLLELLEDKNILLVLFWQKN